MMFVVVFVVAVVACGWLAELGACVDPASIPSVTLQNAARPGTKVWAIITCGFVCVVYPFTHKHANTQTRKHKHCVDLCFALIVPAPLLFCFVFSNLGMQKMPVTGLGTGSYGGYYHNDTEVVDGKLPLCVCVRVCACFLFPCNATCLHSLSFTPPTQTLACTHVDTRTHTHTYSLSHPYSAAVYNWLKAGGRRIDASLTYHDQVPVGRGIKLSGLARNEVFITSKVGPGLPLGYKDTLSQFEQILASLETTYVDLVCTAG